MRQLKTIPAKSRVCFPHEALDAYWFAEMLRYRALKIAADAKCKSTTGRGLDAALGRVIRCIAEAADGRPERADALVARARAALGVAITRIKELSIMRSVRAVVVEDLHKRALRLRGRLETLDGDAVETWPTSNELPTVLDDARNDARDRSRVDVMAALAKLPGAALRDLPYPVVAKDVAARPPSNHEGAAAGLPADAQDKPVASTVM